VLDDGRSFHMEILLVDHFYHGKLVRTKTTTRETFAEVRSADTTTAHPYDRESGQRIREGGRRYLSSRVPRGIYLRIYLQCVTYL
jgi:hypothetical protein